MKKDYLKPNAEYIDIELEKPIMANVFNPSWDIDEDEDIV